MLRRVERRPSERLQLLVVRDVADDDLHRLGRQHAVLRLAPRLDDLAPPVERRRVHFRFHVHDAAVAARERRVGRHVLELLRRAVVGRRPVLAAAERRAPHAAPAAEDRVEQAHVAVPEVAVHDAVQHRIDARVAERQPRGGRRAPRRHAGPEGEEDADEHARRPADDERDHDADEREDELQLALHPPLLLQQQLLRHLVHAVRLDAAVRQRRPLVAAVRGDRVATLLRAVEDAAVAHRDDDHRQQHDDENGSDVVRPTRAAVEHAHVRVVAVHVRGPSGEPLRSPGGAVEPREHDVDADGAVRERPVVARVPADVTVALEGDEHQRLDGRAAAREHEERVGVAHPLAEAVAAEVPRRQRDRHHVRRDDEVGEREVHDEHVAAHVQRRLDGHRADEEQVAERAERGDEAEED